MRSTVQAMPSLALAALLCVTSAGVHARAQEAPPPVAAPTVTVAPPETREVVAEGRAAINLERGGVPGAREAAIAQALRAAVEKTTGVFVSARTLTSNYRLVQDEVTTRAEGFVTLGEVLSEQVKAGEVRVTVRALVSLRPLAKRLKELNLARAWRIHLDAGRTVDTSALGYLQQTLTEAGFSVVAGTSDAPGATPDLVVRVTAKPTTVATTELETAAGEMTLHSLRVEVGLRALRHGTNEIVAALSSARTVAHIDAATARATGAQQAMAGLAPRLADLLMVLPAQASQPVTLVVANLARAAQVGKLHDALHSLPGVRAVTRRSWEKQTAIWELDVTTEVVPLLARALEEDAAVRPFRLAQCSDNIPAGPAGYGTTSPLSSFRSAARRCLASSE